MTHATLAMTWQRCGVVICLLATALIAGCQPAPVEPLRVGTNVWIGSEPMYLARELGYLPDETARLVEYPSASEVLRAFRNQALDGMLISLDELMLLAVDDLEPRVVLVIDESQGADVVIGRRGIRSMKDLQGKRVAVESGAVGGYVLSRALEKNGLSPEDVLIVHLEANEHVAAFEQGRVDAAVTFDPFRAAMLRAGGRVLFDSRQIPGEVVDLLAVRSRVLKSNPAALQVLLTGWFKALDYLRRRPLDAARRMSVRQQVSGEQFLSTLRGLRFPTRAENLALLGGSSPGLVATGGRLMDQMLDAELLSAPVHIESLLAAAPLQELPD